MPGPTTVVRLRRRGGIEVQGCDVYIGRKMCMGGWKLPASDWANPFSVKECGSNAEACRRYEAHLRGRPDLMARLGELRGKRLGCWCRPEPCHGDILARLADSAAADSAAADGAALLTDAELDALLGE